jgi:hypothetical protein
VLVPSLSPAWSYCVCRDKKRNVAQATGSQQVSPIKIVLGVEHDELAATREGEQVILTARLVARMKRQ